MQTIAKLAGQKMSVDFALKKTLGSYSFVKFYANGEVADEMEVWFSAKCTDSYKAHLEEQARQILNLEFSIELKHGAILPSSSSTFCIVYSDNVVPDTATIEEQQKDVGVNGWRVYFSSRERLWKVMQRVKSRYTTYYTSEEREAALDWAQCNFTRKFTGRGGNHELV